MRMLGFARYEDKKGFVHLLISAHASVGTGSSIFSSTPSLDAGGSAFSKQRLLFAVEPSGGDKRTSVLTDLTNFGTDIRVNPATATEGFRWDLDDVGGSLRGPSLSSSLNRICPLPIPQRLNLSVD